MMRKSILVLMLVFASSWSQAEEDTLPKANLGDASLFYEDYGSGTPVVFVHGTTSNMFVWDPVLETVAKSHRAIAYSRRYNFPNANDYSIPDNHMHRGVEDLKALVEKLELDRFHLVGSSWGSVISLRFAALYPERLLSLSVAEPPLFRWLEKIEGHEADYTRMVVELPQRTNEAFGAGDDIEALRRFIEGLAGVPIPPLDPENEGTKIQLGSSLDLKAAVQSKAGFPDLADESVAGIETPTLILYGEKSFPYFLPLMVRLDSLLPNSRREMIPAAGHGLYQENPVATSRLLVDHFSTHSKTN